jgi:hypothetical protein
MTLHGNHRTISTGAWKSRTQREIPTFPQADHSLLTKKKKKKKKKRTKDGATRRHINRPLVSRSLGHMADRQE